MNVTSDTVRHPLFARCYERLSRFMDRELAPRRSALLAGLSGRVVEIGAGNGLNFAHYPVDVTEVVAVEPERYLRERARREAATAPVPVIVADGLAGELAYEDASFDAAVFCLVLCTVPDPAAALADVRRLLTPGGELRFLEHVRSERPRKARVQRWADRTGAWPLVSGGCNCSRATLAEIRASGFEVAEMEKFTLGPEVALTNPVIQGVARPA